MNENIDILLSRYFSGEASRQELEQLDDWLAESAGNEAYFTDMIMLYQQSAFTGVIPDFDTQKALNDFKAYIRKEKQIQVPRKSFRLISYIRVVAAVAIILTGLFTFFILRDESQVVQLIANNTIKEYVLANNIKVSLSSESEIVYSDNDKNNVKLIGEATFSIGGDGERKFIVRAGETFIKHIGTVFTVSARDANKQVIVEVHEGEVLFFTEQNEGIYVKTNERAVYNSVKKEFVLYAAPKGICNELMFHAKPLDEVRDILERYYNIDIILSDPQLNDLCITVSFDLDDPIESVLEVIAETLSLTLVGDGRTFILSQ